MTYKGYLIDLDGTIYKGRERIPAGEAFVRELQGRGIPHLFVTNNTIRTPEAVRDMLAELCELDVPVESVYTASLATVEVMNELGKGNARLSEEVLTKNEQMEEEFFLGLRKKSGVSLSRFEKKFETSFENIYGQVVRDLTAEGLVQLDGDRLRMTQKGLFLGDTVAERFILDKEE